MRKYLWLLMLESLLIGAEKPQNLFFQDTFTPVCMHGKVTAVRGWNLRDGGRMQYMANGKYLSGEECFRLDCKNGVFSFQFPDKFPYGYDFSKATLAYWPNTCLRFAARFNDPLPPAPKYRTVARVRFNKGQCSLNSHRRIQPGKEWTKIDEIWSEPFRFVNFIPEPGSRFEFADFKCLAVYPKLGGEIVLPDGGRLTRFVISKNAGYLIRWNVSLWRGWFWKLTGKALPIEEVDSLQPTQNAFVAIPDGTLPEGAWRLIVNKSGIVLRYQDPLSISSALFDYLHRTLNCGFYAADCHKLPKDGSVKQLPPLDFTAKPRFGKVTGDGDHFVLNGGVPLGMLYTANDVNYYHLPIATNDHVVNVVLPMEMYWKTHPEYYSMNSQGKRFAASNPWQTNPCFSNKDGMDIMLKNAVIYATNQVASRYLCVTPGDIGSHCLCADCVKLNGGKNNCSDAVMYFTEAMAAALEKKAPEIMVRYAAYASRHTVPTHVKSNRKNLRVDYCLGHDVLPCTLHVDCPLNRPGLQQIKQWLAYCGNDPIRMGYETYRDIRPLHHQRQMAFLNQFAKDHVYMFYWKGYSPATQFVMSRWNLGEDTEKLLLEFDRAYFGKGGDIMFQIDKRVDQWAMNYKHTERELYHLPKGTHVGVWGDDLTSKTFMTREILDEIYPLFDKALAAAGNDRKARRHILREKGRYLVEDLHKFNRTSCKSKEELAAFYKRLVHLISFAKEAGMDQCMYGLPARRFVNACSGLEIPTSPRTFWTDEPIVKDFVKNPAKYFTMEPELIPDGWYFKPVVMKSVVTPVVYSYECPPRMSIGLLRAPFQQHKLSVTWKIPFVPTRPMCLALEGLDDDKPGRSSFRILVNGKQIFKGPCSFPEKEWGRMGFMIPADALKQGENLLVLENATPEEPNRSARYLNDPEQAKLDSQWGWITFSEIYILDVEQGFLNLCAGINNPDSHWRINCAEGVRKMGNSKAVNGVIEMTAAENEQAQVAYFGKGSHRAQKIAYTPRQTTLTVSIRARGTGKLKFRIATYQAHLRSKDKSQMIPDSGYAGNGDLYYVPESPKYQLTSEEKQYTFTMKMPGSTAMTFPLIMLEGPGKAYIRDFTFRFK